MPIIRHINEEPREIHLRQLRADFIFRKGRQQRIVKVAAQNLRRRVYRARSMALVIRRYATMS